MRKIYLMTIVALGLWATQLNAQETAIAEMVTTAPVIDGDLSDWDFTTNTQQATKMQTVNPEWTWVPQDNLLYWKATWDENNLYLAAVVVADENNINDANHDNRINCESKDKNGDFVRFAIGDMSVPADNGCGESDKVTGFFVLYRNDGTKGVNGEIVPNEYIVLDDDDVFGTGKRGYIVELRVEWPQLNITPSSNLELRFNIQNRDYDQFYEDEVWKDNAGYVNSLGWATTDETWASMENAGKLTLDASTSSNSHIEMEKLKFSLSPNPASDKLNVRIAGDIQAIKIFSITGQLMSNVEIANKTLVSIDVADLAKGVYLLQANTKDGIFTKRFVKK